MTGWKNKIPGSSTSKKEYNESFRIALQLNYLTLLGSITEKGYKLYLSLLAIIGKNSVVNAPPRKSYIWFLTIDELKEMSLVEYSEIKHDYALTSNGNNLIKVLAKGLTNNGVPRIWLKLWEK